MLPAMIDYLIKNFFTEIDESTTDKDLKNKFMFEKIVKDTADLVALWQCYGFCHGVLNTDNLSVMGVTIDYGPFAWMEHHDPDFICNHSDQDRGRYRYKA
jgi:serine/tyrosine/threonine adenylyltransferase